jgi:hypothetical protein
MTKALRLATRKPQLPVKTLPLNFLLGCSKPELDNFELSRLAEVADLRKELHAILDRVIDAMSLAAIATWFKSQDRQSLKHAIENEESPVEWAKRMLRDGQRSAEELIPLPPLAPGAAHLAASLRYQKRNIAESKCQNCPDALDPRSHRYCTKHLRMERERHVPKRHRIEPGSIAWLYGETLEPGRAWPREYQKQRRIAPEGRTLLQRIANELGLTFEHVRRVAIGDMRSERIMVIIKQELDAILKKGQGDRRRFDR